MKFLLQNIIEYVPIILLAAVGGMVRYLNLKPADDKVKLGQVVVEIIVAGFAGLVVSFALSPLDLSPQLAGATAALAGYSAKAILLVLEKNFIEKIKKKMGEEE